MTKHVHDVLGVEDLKVEISPQIIDNCAVIGTPPVAQKSKGKVKVRVVKAKVTTRKSRLEKATRNLYDLEDCLGPEKPLNIDLGLYQMEDY
ncbi:MAG: hypothetical protein NWE98_06885 [Candidatus Bathyarchaeota archaeon]|nr:hypothetical protein [Candidatus Bathyarchaeota archaeon]